MTKDAFLDSFLSDQERDSLQTIADNPTAMCALKKLILADVFYKGVLRKGLEPDPTRNAAYALAFSPTSISDEQLGQDIRGQAEGVRLVEAGFGRLEKLKSVGGSKETPPNPAR